MPVPPTPPVTSAPIDPATMSGVRDNPLYIGATNFSTLQKQYTPYQIEQATTRDASGNIFWKQGMDIKNVPTSAPSATLAPPATKPPMPTSVAAVPAPTLTAPPATSAEFQARNTAAQTYLTGLDASIDNIRKEQEMRLAAQKVEQEKTVDTLKGKLSEMMNGTQYQDSLKRDRELFQVEQQVRDLGEIRSKIADAQNALTQGLIFEEGRPTRMELLTGRSAELKKQGLAHIQSLQSTAEIIKGNIDLARAYADDSIDALRRDNEQKIGALNTLLDLESKKLTSLSEDEKATVKERMNALKEESDRLVKDKDQVFELSTKFPQAFSKAGVTFRDTPEQAMTKLMPHLSEYEKLELQKKQLEIAEIQSRIDENKAQAKKAISGSGSGSTGGASTPITEEVAAFIAYLRQGGKTEQEIREEVYQNYGSKFKKQSDLSGIVDNVLQGAPKALTPQQEQADRVLKYRQDLEAKGILEIDPEKGTYVSTTNADMIQAALRDGKIQWTGTNWKDATTGREITDPGKIRYEDVGWVRTKMELKY